jgi:hypothetical protein
VGGDQHWLPEAAQVAAGQRAGPGVREIRVVVLLRCHVPLPAPLERAAMPIASLSL